MPLQECGYLFLALIDSKLLAPLRFHAQNLSVFHVSNPTKQGGSIYFKQKILESSVFEDKLWEIMLETKLRKNEKHQTQVSLLLELVSDAYLTANRTRMFDF